MACELFGFHKTELVGIELRELLTLKSKSPQTVAESTLDSAGEVCEMHGKVVSQRCQMPSMLSNAFNAVKCLQCCQMPSMLSNAFKTVKGLHNCQMPSSL